MTNEAVHYSDTVLEHFERPRNAGEMLDASVDYFVTNPISGDSMRLFLLIEGERIARASFLTTGGPASIATASVATELVTGKTLDQATAITRQQLVEAVGGLPASKIQCSVIAAAAIRNAVAKWRRENGSAATEG
jgi:nitrogen fixation protein NifU and related proteins